MGLTKKSDGRYVVGKGIADGNEYKGSAAWRDMVIQYSGDGATDKSLEYLTFLKDYALYHSAQGEPVIPPNVQIWMSTANTMKAVEADDITVDGETVKIGSCTWDGSNWSFAEPTPGGGGGGKTVVDNTPVSGVIMAGPKTVSVSSGSDAVLCNYSPIDADFFDLSLSIDNTPVSLERTEEGWDSADWYAYIDTDYTQTPQAKAWFLGKVDGESATITVTDFAYSGYSYSLDSEAAGLPVALFKDESFTTLLTQFLGG